MLVSKYNDNDFGVKLANLDKTVFIYSLQKANYNSYEEL